MLSFDHGVSSLYFVASLFLYFGSALCTSIFIVRFPVPHVLSFSFLLLFEPFTLWKIHWQAIIPQIVHEGVVGLSEHHITIT